MISAKAAEKARSKAEQKDRYNAFLAACPSRQLLDRISDKWVVLVLCALGGEPGNGGEGAKAMRYSELSRQLAGVSQKMLTQTLRALERDGLLTRTVTPTVPVSVSYNLTALGHSLHDVAQELRRWAQENMGEVAAHRRDYDDGAADGSGSAPPVSGNVVNGPPKTR